MSTDTQIAFARRLRRATAGVVNQTWLIVVLLVAWWLISEVVTTPLVPSLRQIVTALGEGLARGTMLEDLAYSLTNFVVAVACACVVGVCLGIGLGLSRTVYRVLDPLLQYVRSIPKVALVPLFVVFLGIGREPKIVLIALTCLWPILLNTADGIRGMHPRLLDVSRAYRLPRAVTMFRVVLPAIGPQVFAGIRVAIGLGVVLLVVSEMYGAVEGIGFSILQAGRSFQLPATWAGTLALGILGYAISLVFELIERGVLKWHFSARSNA